MISHAKYAEIGKGVFSQQIDHRLPHRKLNVDCNVKQLVCTCCQEKLKKETMHYHSVVTVGVSQIGGVWFMVSRLATQWAMDLLNISSAIDIYNRHFRQLVSIYCYPSPSPHGTVLPRNHIDSA
jgi:hypothetical protein